MQQDQKLYSPKNDPHFSLPYVDVEEWRDTPCRHLYVHGGFENTNVRFSLYYPPAESYQKRFFHAVTPVQGHEDASQGLEGDEDNIGFAVSHGAYFVESNMGGDDPDFTMLYRSSAAVAEYSRTVASRLFGEHRPFGYIYGGSGGAFKTIGCVQNTAHVWDGSVPFVMGSPMSIPNMFTVRVHAMRLLRDKLPIVIDAVEPGGSGDMYAGLNEEEAAALREATRMGFPPRVWFSHNEIGAGALPVLTYAVDQMDPAYYTDFWTLPGYLGSDPNGSAVRDRFRFETTVGSVVLPENAYKTDDMGVDDAWQTLAVRYESDPKIVLADTPETPAYADGTKICITSGAAAGLKLPMNVLSGNTVTVGAAFGMGDITVALSAVQPGDRVVLDNSDYIALQTYHRHQVPGPEYPAWDQFRDAGGVPIYPQRKVIVGPMVAFSGAGSVQSGFFSGKMITIASLLDESALPWQPDWYRKKVREHFAEGTDDVFRLWYSDNAMHGGDYTPELGAHVVSYRAALNQALLDLSNWVERGIQPADNSAYEIVDAQVHIPAEAAQRKGIQPVVGLTVQGEKMASIPVGGTVDFEGYIEAPPGAGVVTGAAFDFDGSGQYAYKVEALAYLDADRQSAHVRVSYAFDKAGTYFPSLRGTISRIGAERDPYTQVKNLARVRVVVKG